MNVSCKMNRTKKPVVVVKFEDPCKRKIPSSGVGKKGYVRPDPDAPQPRDPVKFDFNRARHEIFKFGIEGMEQKTKVDAKVSQAIRLGAEPPRNKYINYKQLMEDRKKEREELKRKRIEDKDHFSLKRPANDIRNKKKDSNDVGRMDYIKGTMKDGVLTTSRTKKLPRN